MSGQGDYRGRRRERGAALSRTKEIVTRTSDPASRVKKIRRARTPGAITIAQTRDFAQVAAVLEAAGTTPEHHDKAGSCFLIAYSGDDPIGVAGIETAVDVAVMRSLWVAEPMRRRGIGAALVAAVRKAAHTRGARMLYAVVSIGKTDCLGKLGFVPASQQVAINPLKGLLGHPEELARSSIWMLDLSRDGIIER